jgi:hypothetical protein
MFPYLSPLLQQKSKEVRQLPLNATKQRRFSLRFVKNLEILRQDVDYLGQQYILLIKCGRPA